MTASLILFLIDETDAMAAPLPAPNRSAQKKTKADAICTLINAQLNKLSEQQNLSVAIVGYQGDAEGNPHCGTRWKGPLAQSSIVTNSDLSSSVLRTEQRVRKLPQGGEQTFDFPVWYEMTPQGKGGYAAALTTCSELIDEWTRVTSQPTSAVTLCHIHAANSEDICDNAGELAMADIMASDPAPQVLQVQLADSVNPSEILFPRGPAHLPLGEARQLLDQSSPLSAAFVSALKDRGFSVTDRAKGLLYNATLKSISQTLTAIASLTTTTLQQDPSPAEEGPEESHVSEGAGTEDPDAPIEIERVLSEEPTAESPHDDGGNPSSNQAMLFILDRGTNEPQSPAAAKVIERLQAEANRHLQQLSKHDSGSIDVAVLAYGTIDGQPAVLSPIMQDAEKNSWAPNDSLEERAIRTEETEEQIPNGAGGLLTIPRKNMIFLDLTATEYSDPRPAFKRAAAMISAWQAAHPAAGPPPMLLHLTSGSWNEAAIQEAAKSLAESSTESILYHHIATELPHPSVAYPETENALDHPSLAAAWQCTSPLINVGEYQTRSNISDSSRGIVVNGKFDLLFDVIAGVPSR